MQLEECKNNENYIICLLLQKKLKCLTICVDESYGKTSKLYCEIDLLSIENNVKVYIEGVTPLIYSIGVGLFTTEYSYSDKTIVYECSILDVEIFQFLHSIFYNYDIRKLSHYALERNCLEDEPILSYEECPKTYIIVQLEAEDGIVDIIRMNPFSIGGRILSECIKECELLNDILMI